MSMVAKLSSTLMHLGYHQSKTDYSLFSHHNSTTITLILVYVDDLLICGNFMDKINSLRKILCSTLHMKDLGSLRYFLGLEVDRNDTGIFLCQRKYTLDIIKEYGLPNAKPLLLPKESNLILTNKGGLL